MGTTAVQDRLVLTVADVKEFLNITVSTWDDLLADLLDAAKEDADAYLNNPFLDSSGAEADIPGPVKYGVIRWIEAEFPFSPGAPAGGVVSEKAGDVSVTYASGSLPGTSENIPAGAKRLWKKYRFLPGL